MDPVRTVELFGEHVLRIVNETNTELGGVEELR